MDSIQRAIVQVRRRIIAAAALRIFCVGVLAAIGVSLLMLAGSRLMGQALPWWSYTLSLIPAGLLAGIIAWWRKPDDFHTAMAIDHTMGLKDSLSSALYAWAQTSHPFARQVIDNGTATASRLVVKDAFPVRFTRSWTYVPPMVAAFFACYWLLPADILGYGQKRIDQQLTQQLQEQAQAQAKNDLVKIIDQTALMQDPKTGDQLPPDLKEDLKGLADLTNRDLSNPDMQKRTAAQLSALQEKLDQTAQQKEQQFESIQNTLSRLDIQQPGPADAFAQALRSGDFASALKELDKLAREAEKLPPDQRQAVQEQLKNLANQLNQAAAAMAQQAQSTQQQMNQAMQNAGMNAQQSQQVQQMMQSGATQQQIAQKLQQNGMNPQQAQQVAQQLSQMNQRQQGQNQSQQMTQNLSQSMNQMSSACQNPGGSSPSQQNGQNGQQNNMQQAANNAQQQISQMSQMQNALQQMRMSQAQTQQAMQSLGQCSGNGQNPGSGMGGGQGQNPMPGFNNPLQQQASAGNKTGSNGTGTGIGTGNGGNPLGQERSISGYQTQAQGDLGQGDGRIIASWLTPGQNSKGEATAGFDSAVTQAKTNAEKSITEDRVPKRYQGAVKDYFDQLPQSPDQVQKAPAAPR